MGSPHETSVGKRKSQRIRGVIFFVGTVLSLTLSGLAVRVGSLENLHGNFIDQDTGQWDWWYVAHYFIWPLVLWVLLFALFGGFRQQEKK